MEAQRHPEDFNGIIAAAPAYNWSHLFTSFVWNEQALVKTAGSNLTSKLPAKQKGNTGRVRCDCELLTRRTADDHS